MNLAYNDYLKHHGVKGQKWGIRRYQNEDGTLTTLGKKRYGTSENFNAELKKAKDFARISSKKANIRVVKPLIQTKKSLAKWDEKNQKLKEAYFQWSVEMFLDKRNARNTERAKEFAKMYNEISLDEFYKLGFSSKT